MTSDTSMPPPDPTHESRIKVRLRQVAAIVRLELRKGFLGKRAFIVYLLGILPVLLMVMLVSGPQSSRNLKDPQKASILFADVYVIFILRAVVFFGCAWIFMNLFRAEGGDKVLHYYFLAPVRRDVLLFSKYLSGLLIALSVFVSATFLSLVFLYIPAGYSASSRYILDGQGLDQGLSYLLITCLACLSYGAAFQLVGLLTRNPALPVLLIYLWESINFLLPTLLKRISITYYLQTFSPIPISEGPFAIIAEPQPAWASLLSLLGLTSLMLVIATVKFKKMEINYT